MISPNELSHRLREIARRLPSEVFDSIDARMMTEYALTQTFPIQVRLDDLIEPHSADLLTRRAWLTHIGVEYSTNGWTVTVCLSRRDR